MQDWNHAEVKSCSPVFEFLKTAQPPGEPTHTTTLFPIVQIPRTSGRTHNIMSYITAGLRVLVVAKGKGKGQN
jgi:hypothetical protein